MRSNVKLIAVILIAIVAVGLYIALHKTPEKTAKPVSAAMVISVVTPEEKTLQHSVIASGLVVPREDIIVTTELTGVRIRQVFADEGRWVKKGDRLALLDPIRNVNQLDQVEARYQEAKRDFERVDSIKDTGAVSMETVTQKRADYQAARAERDTARLNVMRTFVRAPSNGVIYERQARIGDLIDATTPLYRIALNGEIELEAMVSEGSLPQLQTGQSAMVIVTGRSEPVKGTIRLISPRIDNNTRTAKLRITLPKDETIPIGAFAEATMGVGQQEGLAVPQTAVMTAGDMNTVWILDEKNQAHTTPVTVTLRADGLALIEGEAITPSTRVVAKAGPFLTEGEKVEIAQ